MTDPSLIASITSWFTPTSLFILVNLVIGTIAVTSRFTSPKKPDNQQEQLGPYDSPRLARAPSLIDRVKSINFSLYKFPQHEPHFLQPTELAHGTYPSDPQEKPPNQLEQLGRCDSPPLTRAPSLLDRVKSINFSLYKFPQEEEPHFLQPTEPAYDAYPSDPNPPQLARAASLLERVKSIKFPSVYRSQQAHPETETEVIHKSENEVSSVSKPRLDPGHKPKGSTSETKKSKPRVQQENMKKSVSEKSMTVEAKDDEMEMVERRRPETARLDRTVTIGDGDQSVDAKADDFINKFRRQLKLQRLDSLLRYKEMLQGK